MCVVLLRFLPCFIDMDFVGGQYGRRVDRKNYLSVLSEAPSKEASLSDVFFYM